MTRLRTVLDDAGVLFDGAADRALAAGDEGPEILGVTHDSRRVQPGWVFCCVPGATVDGHRFVAAAVEAGAVAVVCERPLDVAVPQIRVASTRQAMGPIASSFHGHPSRSMKVVGITGTNGKTTTVGMLRAILDLAGQRTATIGTLSGQRTTPEAPDLQEQLATLRDSGHDAVALEVSSHALALHRVDGTRFAAVGFTNLTRDHLDFHTTMEQYFKAKALLFTADFAPIAVIDADSPNGRLLAATTDIATVTASGLSTVSITDLSASGTTFRWRGVTVTLPIPGRFNAANAVLAGDLAVALGVAPGVVADALSSVEPAPGRFQRVPIAQPFAVFVDYAHTPDGLEHVLAAAREVTKGGHVIVVFGCGGDRDATKRPFMGRAAREGADVVVVTTDNPRSEDPAQIAAEVVAGMATRPDYIELDRRRAISLALSLATEGDIVIVAGKGHETTQQIGDAVHPFDDRQVVSEQAMALISNEGRR